MVMCSSIRKGQRFLGLGERRAVSVSSHLDLLRLSPLPTTFPYPPHHYTLRAPSTCGPFLPSLAPPHSIPPNQLSHLPCHQHLQSQYSHLRSSYVNSTPNALISHTSKVMLKILQTRLQQDVQAGFRKVRGTRGQIANTCWIIEKAVEVQKNIYFCFIDYAKAFDCVDHNKLWKILQEMGIPDHLTCLLRNLYTGQEATVRTGQEIKLVPNRKRSLSMLYIVTLLISLLCRVHHEKRWAGGSTSWNQDSW